MAPYDPATGDRQRGVKVLPADRHHQALLRLLDYDAMRSECLDVSACERSFCVSVETGVDFGSASLQYVKSLDGYIPWKKLESLQNVEGMVPSALSCL